MRVLRFNLLFLLTLILATANSNAAKKSAFDEFVVEKVVVLPEGMQKMKFVYDAQMYLERWDTLPQPKFWQSVFTLPPDSAIVNVAATRTELQRVSLKEWSKQTETEKDNYKQSLNRVNQLDLNTLIYITSGKNHFYNFTKVMPHIGKGIEAFIRNGVDPWYAQAIMLIESPNNTSGTSNVGARGPFQLMPYNAKKYGLKVTKYVDERTDLEKSAGAAARFLEDVCISRMRSALDARGIAYNETDLWFRLLVLHAYHSGPNNIIGVLDILNPKEGGLELITKVWQTEYKGFKNQSQNYSQIALAGLLMLDKLVQTGGDTVVVNLDNLKSYSSVKQIQAAETFASLFKEYMSAKIDWINGKLNFADYAEKTRDVRIGLIQSLTFSSGFLSSNINDTFFDIDSYKSST